MSILKKKKKINIFCCTVIFGIDRNRIFGHIL